MKSIKDHRCKVHFDKEPVLSPINEGLKGKLYNKRGIIFVDPDYDLDLKHATDISNFGNFEIVLLRGAAHNTAKVFNKFSSITSLLLYISDCIQGKLNTHELTKRVRGEDLRFPSQQFMDSEDNDKISLILERDSFHIKKVIEVDALILYFKKKKSTSSAAILLLCYQLTKNSKIIEAILMSKYLDFGLNFMPNDYTGKLYTPDNESVISNEINRIPVSVIENETLRLKNLNS